MLKNLLLSTMLVATVNIAIAEDKYPAANFSPTVIYLDAAYQDTKPSSKTVKSTPDAQYPAANFEPKVIYLDKQVSTFVGEKSKPDPKYPAANFEPKVIYP